MDYKLMFRADDELLARCEEEPIHIPGSIQPHGALLAIEPEAGEVLIASANIEEFLDVPATTLIGTDLARWIDSPESASAFKQLLSAGLGNHPENRFSIHACGRLADFDVEAHLSNGNRVILELERKRESQQAIAVTHEHATDLTRIRILSNRFAAATTIEPVLDDVSVMIREITGYDRVMVYKLDDVGHGEVVAESHREGLETFQGLHFPSTDIPARARQLYLRNRVRHLASIAYQPVQLFPIQRIDDANCLDLSLSHLRSFSPVHIEYLANMKVHGTLVISLIVSGKLWGLIACHHYSPMHISSRTRDRCDIFAHMLSLLIDGFESRRSVHAVDLGNRVQRTLDNTIGATIHWQDRLMDHGQTLLRDMQATGFVMVTEGEMSSIGDVPEWSDVKTIIKQHGEHPEADVYKSISLARDIKHFPSAPQYCGCLCTTVSASSDIRLLWFRPEHARQIDWAGDPRKHAIANDDGGVRLSPRKSFEKWTQMVQLESMPWSVEEVATAQAITAFVSKRKIEDAIRVKSQFLANMSHEIRTPLTAILGYSDLLCESTNQNTDQSPDAHFRHLQNAGIIKRNASDLLQVIDDILDLSEIETGKMTVERRPLDPTELLLGIAKIIKRQCAAKKLDFRLFSNGKIPERIISDQNRLHKILKNLLENAVRFTETGKVELEVCYRQADPQVLAFKIHDTGCGIPHRIIEKLFQPFTQADNSMSRKFGGTGLGLSLSQRFAKLLGGDINVVYSKIGNGTCFQVTIGTGLQAERLSLIQPILDLEPQSGITATHSYVNDIDGNPIRVLLAEDGIDNQRLISHILKKHGFQVTTVENGKLAMEAAIERESQNDAFDVILMDMQMPVMDGYEATRQLRIAGFHKPIIAVTAHAMVGDSKKCIAAGCDAYTSKPINRNLLLNAMHDALAKHRQQNPQVSEQSVAASLASIELLTPLS